MFDTAPPELPADLAATCDALAEAHGDRLEVESRQLRLAAHWLDLNAPLEHPGEAPSRTLPGRERYVRCGADGTPLVSEFACAEFAAVQDLHPLAGAAQLRKVANLRHRHPVLWQRALAGEVPAWKALETARLVGRDELGLDVEQARAIDALTASWVTTLPWGSYLRLLEKHVIAADPRGADERRRADEAAHYVATSQTNEHGARTLIAKASAGDVTYLVAVVDRLAELLAARGDTRPVGPRRASALALLAHPAHALKLLAEGTTTGPLPDEPPADDPAPDPADDDVARDAADHPDDEPVASAEDAPAGADTAADSVTEAALAADAGAADAGGGSCAHCARGGEGGLPSYLRRDPVLARAFESLDLDRLLPAATLYVHISGGDLEAAGVGPGAAEVEGIGVITIEQAREWLGHRRVRVVPVLDPLAEPAVDGYEHPRRMREALQLLRPRDVFPFAVNTGRGKDIDHPVPYRPPGEGGPPGQTGLHNAAPMTRFHHRLKTHAGWRLRQVDARTFLWRSPHGHYWLVDATGTHRLPKAAGDWIAREADRRREVSRQAA